MDRFVNKNLRPIFYPRVPLNHRRPIRSSEPLDNQVRLTHPVTNKTHFTPLDYPPLPSMRAIGTSSSPYTIADSYFRSSIAAFRGVCFWLEFLYLLRNLHSTKKRRYSSGIRHP
ncbi:hypothetical protein L1987_65786 [Smallanthus sonchifolius]|uniref:Uncharacterized protein n=1 Tax=Smallanthus sonchifolius TaxID=185202 RepID=A0ACB9BVB4_9ASTR|nr:hypothetical protein L1987_65786 [Smallanthus sonchifolius]